MKEKERGISQMEFNDGDLSSRAYSRACYFGWGHVCNNLWWDKLV